MKILMTADLHCGYHDKLQDCIWAMRAMNEYAHKNGIEDVIVLGDLFHDRVNLNIEVLSSVHDFLKNEAKQRWHAFPGNHDMFMKNSWKHNSIKPLDGVLNAITKAGETEIGGCQFVVLPFIQSEETYLQTLSELNVRDKTLLTHVGVHGAKMNYCFLLQHWTKILPDILPSLVIAGHFHCHQWVGKQIVYPGSPISFRHDDGMVAHGFLTYDDGEIEFHDIYDAASTGDRPPQHLTFNAVDLPDALELADGNNVRIFLDRDHTVNELNVIRDKLTKAGARNVQWVNPKKQEEIEASISNIRINLRDHEATLNSWLEYDKPEGYKRNWLVKLNGMIAEQAEELLVQSGLEDSENE